MVHGPRLRQPRRRIAWHKARHTQRTGWVRLNSWNSRNLRSPQFVTSVVIVSWIMIVNRQCFEFMWLLALHFNQLVAAEKNNRKHLGVQCSYFLDFRTDLRQSSFLSEEIRTYLINTVGLKLPINFVAYFIQCIYFYHFVVTSTATVSDACGECGSLHYLQYSFVIEMQSSFRNFSQHGGSHQLCLTCPLT